MLNIRKPDWLKIHLGNNDRFSATGKMIGEKGLHTICQSGRCPNLGDCWNRGTATFMIGGTICTRSCKFCNTQTGKPLPLDRSEPEKIASSVRDMGLTHVVITSVDRDDLPDYGANHWAETIRQIKRQNPDVTMEVLIPDFRGKTECLELVIQAHPDLISHNVETVRRLTPGVRSVADYETSLDVLRYISSSGIPAKTGLMLGLGETRDEILETMDDILRVGAWLLSIGQYLQPGAKNLPVAAYIHPDLFEEYKQIGLQKGFKHIESAPLVRSSYHSAVYVEKNFQLVL